MMVGFAGQGDGGAKSGSVETRNTSTRVVEEITYIGVSLVIEVRPLLPLLQLQLNKLRQAPISPSPHPHRILVASFSRPPRPVNF